MITYEEALKLGREQTFDVKGVVKKLTNQMELIVKGQCQKLVKDPDVKICFAVLNEEEKDNATVLAFALNEMVSGAGWEIEFDNKLAYCFRRPNKDPKYETCNPYR